MATDIATIRALMPDLPITVIETLDADGVQTSIRTKYYPIVAASVIVTGLTVQSVDEQSGLVGFASAPNAGGYLFQYSFVQLTDTTIQTILDLQISSADGDDDPSVVMMAAALCLDSLASQLAVLQKRIQLLDMQTDGPALAKALRDHADMLRKLVTDPKMQAPAFDFIEQINDNFGYREKILKDYLRNGPTTD